MGKIDPKMLLLLYIVLLPLINTQMGLTGFTLGCLKPEREALLKFKGSVSNKDDAKVLFSWKGDDCCSWYGVTCHNATRHVLRLDLRCDYYPARFSHGYDTPWYYAKGYYHGVSYNFSDMAWLFSSSRGLSFSELNPSLLELRQLTYLDLSRNNFNLSDIPEWIGSMKHLRFLNLSHGGFGGDVPLQLGNLTRLRALDLSRNPHFHSSNLHWLSSLVNLRCVDMSGISITTEALNTLPQVLGHLPLLDMQLSGIGIGNHLLSNIFSNSTLASRIQHLDISVNSLEGSVPRILSNLTSLKFLDLSYNWLIEPMPLWFMSMRGLEFLSLAGNLFSYPLFSHSALPSTIQYLDLSSNILNGPLPLFLSNMTSLKSLDLSFNQLNGSIPLWLGNMKGLEHLYLAANNFSQAEVGTIMGILGNLCHLKSLNLQNSRVGGNFLGLNHENYSNCIEYDLEYLDLTFNNIIDTLPYWLGDWLGEFRKLNTLKLGSNRFYGPIPPSIGNSSSLIELDLSSCNLWGTIPTSLGSLPSLKTLDLSNNFLDGFVPTSLGSLSSLKTLDLSSNMLQGVVFDSHLANLSSLKLLDLSYNNALKLNLNWNKMPTFQLKKLHMQSCKIENQFPQWLTMQNELKTLDLSNTGLFGEIIDWIPNINLIEVNLSNNHIMGPIPHFFPSSQLEYIDFSYNLLSGPLFNNSSSKHAVVEVPLCHLENLQLLHLQSNQLSGTIPDCWGNSEGLSVVDLSSNKLSGSIPMTIGLLPFMAYLKLNNNSLQGTLPATLTQRSWLVILDVGENKLTGEVPDWDAKSHPFLEILIMRANQLEGVIPSRLCLLPRLQFLDLAINKLTGSIPSCFGHFKSMKSLHTDEMAFVASTYEMAPAPAPGPIIEALAMPQDSYPGENAMVVLKGEELQYTTTLKLVVNLDLSSNGLVGSIPEDLTNLSGLIGLNLSNNHLTGIIPQNIGEMGSLTSLDLSNNNLSGTIPSSLSALNFLSSLNLSSNMLHGEIPTGNQLQTLNDPSIYAHNAGLCGEPLPNECGGKHGKEQQPNEEEEEVESTLEKVMFYIVVMLGFATGFWGVVGSLLYNRTWRHALFRRVEYVTDFLYVQFVVRIKRLKN